MLARHGVTPARFEEAVGETADLMGIAPVLISDRQRLCAALAFPGPGGHVLDIGGHVSAYLPLLRRLGAEVTVVDLYSDLVGGVASGPSGAILARRLQTFRQAGITVLQGDANRLSIGGRRFETVSLFELVSAMPLSPRPALERARDAVSAGGRLVLSVANIARLELRMRMLVGRSPFERYARFFEMGSDTGRVRYREMTTAEVRFLAEALGLGVEDLFTTNLSRGPDVPRGPMRSVFSALNRRLALADRTLAPGWRSQIWLVARRGAI